MEMNLTKPLTHASSEFGINLFQLQLPNNITFSIELYKERISFEYQLQHKHHRFMYWNNNMDMRYQEITINQTHINSSHHEFKTSINNQNLKLIYEQLQLGTLVATADIHTTAYIGEHQIDVVVAKLDFFNIPNGN